MKPPAKPRVPKVCGRNSSTIFHMRLNHDATERLDQVAKLLHEALGLRVSRSVVVRMGMIALLSELLVLKGGDPHAIALRVLQASK